MYVCVRVCVRVYLLCPPGYLWSDPKGQTNEGRYTAGVDCLSSGCKIPSFLKIFPLYPYLSVQRVFCSEHSDKPYTTLVTKMFTDRWRDSD